MSIILKKDGKATGTHPSMYCKSVTTTATVRTNSWLYYNLWDCLKEQLKRSQCLHMQHNMQTCTHKRNTLWKALLSVDNDEEDSHVHTHLLGPTEEPRLQTRSIQEEILECSGKQNLSRVCFVYIRRLRPSGLGLHNGSFSKFTKLNTNAIVKIV